MRTSIHLLLAALVSAAAAALLSTVIGRALMLSGRGEVVRLGVVLFVVGLGISLPLVLTVRRR
jgi:thiol:disulfide interchange protein